MPHGGARNRGPLTRSPNSEAARQRRAGAVVLPAEGYQGAPPPFPLPDPSDRELELWCQAWRTPQASVWADESWRWRTVALWTRWSVRAEDPEASAAVATVTARMADQVGLSPAGLVENGWRVADPDDKPLHVVSSERRDRPGFTVARTGVPVPALERARLKAEGRDPREALHED